MTARGMDWPMGRSGAWAGARRQVSARWKVSLAPPARKVLRLVGAWVPCLLLAGLAAVGVSLVELQVPLQVERLVNAMQLRRGEGLPWAQVALLAGLFSGSQLLKVAQRLSAEWPIARVGARLFEEGMRHLLAYPLAWHTANHSAALQVRLDRSSRSIAELLKLGLVEILPSLAGMAIATHLIWQRNSLVGAVALATIPVLSVLTLWQARSQAGVRVALNRGREALGVRVAEAVLGIEQVKLFGAERAEARRVGEVAGALARQEFGHQRAMAVFDLLKFWAERAGALTVLVLGLAAWQAGSSLGPGGVMALVMLYGSVTDPVRHLHRIIDETAERWILARDYLRLLEVMPVDRPAAAPCERRGLPVRLEGVTFAYAAGSGPALREVSLSLPAGARAAVVGPSGCGKSTLAKLIAGLYGPQQGRVRVGGAEVEPLERGGARRVGMLSQEIYLFAGTVAENIRYGRPEASDAEVARAAEIAGLGGFIEGLAEGYDTLLGQRGAGLSGGQKQRLALARVILQDPDVVLFDEPSAALDPENARRFFHEVLALFAARTVIVITHDLRDLSWAQQVVELEQGRVVRCGEPAAAAAPVQRTLLPTSRGLCRYRER